ncbi:hypothetical protein D3C78_1566300 [compost metagenome]
MAGVRRLQQLQRHRVELQQAGQPHEAFDLAFHAAGVQLQLAVALLAQGVDAVLHRKLVGQRAAQQYQPQQQAAQEQRFADTDRHGGKKRCGQHGMTGFRF